MLSAGDRAGVAVSGGADSVVLLHILHRLSFQLGIQLTVLHVNHGLRGCESEGDEAFVRELAGSLGIECLVERADVAPGNLEQETRLVRRAFFLHSMQNHSLRRVAVGHTQSDQAETVLFRLLRGTGLAGVAGMRLTSAEGLIRPLLTTSRQEVRRWAEAESIAWREDSSNAELGFSRNRLRNDIIPALATHFNPNLEGVLAASARLAQDEEAYWSQQIEVIYPKITKRTDLGSILQVPALSALHVAVQRRVVRRALVDVRGDLRSIDIGHVEAILGICSSGHGHDRVMVPGVDALRSFDSLLLALPGELQSRSRHYRVELKVGEPCRLPFEAGWIYVERVTPGTSNCANFKTDWELSAEVADVPLSVRNWEPGDQLQRPGHRREKIKTLFQEERVLLWERRHWPVVVAQDEIVWVRQFGSEARFAASDECISRIRITYRKSGE